MWEESAVGNYLGIGDGDYCGDEVVVVVYCGAAVGGDVVGVGGGGGGVV